MTTNHIEAASNTATYFGASLTGIAWLWNWMGVNHDAITAACAMIGAVIAVTGLVVNLMAKKKIARRK